MPPVAQCLLVPALLALRGEAPAPHPVVHTPPSVLTGVALPGPPTEKGIYGGRLDNHVDSGNFTVAWSNGAADQSAAELASQAMEEAWMALIDEQGWPQPTSSDDFLVWVLLDPSLSGTGVTVPYTSSDYPGGYPVIYLNPSYATNTSFFRSLAAHEFMHAIQFAMRDYYQGDEETWYWEASAEWAAELALPEEDAYGYQSRWYSEQPELRYSSTTNFHPYGMFVLNAYIDQQLSGPGGLLAIWEEGEGRDGEDWDLIIEDATGTPAADIWGGFTAAMGEGSLDEFDLYAAPEREGPLEDGVSGELAYLGTHYYRVTEATGVRATGEVRLSSASGQGEELELQRGDVLAVTGLRDNGADYSLELFEPSTQDSVPFDDTGDIGGEPLKDQGGLTCSSAGAGSAGAAGEWWLVMLVLSAGCRR